METIKSIVVQNMKKITFIMIALILLFTAVIETYSVMNGAKNNAQQIFGQVEQILKENSTELDRAQQEYSERCLNDAKSVAYILEYNPQARNNTQELKKIAANTQVDEIHIFNTQGVIVSGTNPEYYGYSFDSGSQMAFFKPLLTDYSLELVQDILPNTAIGTPMQYSALWSEDRSFIVQIGMYPERVLQATRKNELSHIFSLLRTGMDYRLCAIDPETQTVLGSTVPADLGRGIGEMGVRLSQLKSEKPFFAGLQNMPYYCFSKSIDGNYIIWATPISNFCSTILSTEFILLVGLMLIALIIVRSVVSTMDRTVIEQIQRVNVNLRAIEHGDLTTRVTVEDSKEFSELSEHINSMVESLLESSKTQEMSQRIQQQKETLELQHVQLQEAVTQAKAASMAKSEFLFSMSHDLRTPMNAIIGFTGFALKSEDFNTQHEYLENIDSAARQLMDIINSILEFSKIENNRIVIDEELVDIGEECRKLEAVFSTELKKKNLTYTTKANLQHPWMYLDRAHYSQIYLNIVSNAVKFTPEGGTINAYLSELPGDGPGNCWMETVIEDSGIGMSKEFLNHVCEAFARERTSTASGVQGTGLGLSIVEKLVHLMRGTLAIESEQGKGTKVIIRLPLRVGEPVREQPPEKAPCDEERFKGKRILLAEDIDINAVISTKMLTAKGFLVDRARDGVECVDMLLKSENGYYDLILMDIQMPNMDGYTATRTIRSFEDEKKAHIPILALTANTFKEDQDKARESGMEGHIGKPLDAAKMFQSIAQALDAS